MREGKCAPGRVVMVYTLGAPLGLRGAIEKESIRVCVALYVYVPEGRPRKGIPDAEI